MHKFKIVKWFPLHRDTEPEEEEEENGERGMKIPHDRALLNVYIYCLAKKNEKNKIKMNEMIF